MAVPDHVGWYLAGLTDGEGCFSIASSSRSAFACAFIVHLRADDRTLLEELQQQTGLGAIYIGRRERIGGDQPSLRWVIQRRSDCLSLVAIFEQFPLRSKKARDFAIWSEAVRAWSAGDFGRMKELWIGLRVARMFEAAGEDWFFAEPSPQLSMLAEEPSA